MPTVSLFELCTVVRPSRQQLSSCFNGLSAFDSARPRTLYAAVQCITGQQLIGHTGNVNAIVTCTNNEVLTVIVRLQTYGTHCLITIHPWAQSTCIACLYVNLHHMYPPPKKLTSLMAVTSSNRSRFLFLPLQGWLSLQWNLYFTSRHTLYYVAALRQEIKSSNLSQILLLCSNKKAAIQLIVVDPFFVKHCCQAWYRILMLRIEWFLCMRQTSIKFWLLSRYYSVKIASFYIVFISYVASISFHSATYRQIK